MLSIFWGCAKAEPQLFRYSPNRTEVHYSIMNASLEGNDESIGVTLINKHTKNIVNDISQEKERAQYDENNEPHQFINDNETRISTREIPKDNICLIYIVKNASNAHAFEDFEPIYQDKFRIDTLQNCIFFTSGKKLVLPKYDGSCYLLTGDENLIKLEITTFTLQPYIFMYERDFREYASKERKIKYFESSKNGFQVADDGSYVYSFEAESFKLPENARKDRWIEYIISVANAQGEGAKNQH